ncbi:MAG: universal stress protein [Limisphaerales bacterium]
MSQPSHHDGSAIETILHPSDFSEAGESAFAHALKAALTAHARLYLLHVEKAAEEAAWADFPGVRGTLGRWGLIQPGSDRSAVPALGIEVRKVMAHGSDPVPSILHFLEKHPMDLIVLGVHHHSGATHWLHRSVAEPVARKSGSMTLFVPHGVAGFVARDTGAVSLRNILVPIAATPRPQPAVAGAARIARRLNCPTGMFTLLHVGESGSAPAVETPEVPGWTWRRETRPGEVIETILRTAEETSADLIVMATDGRNGFLDALRGSHSERLIRRAKSPLLAIPQGASAERVL